MTVVYQSTIISKGNPEKCIRITDGLWKQRSYSDEIPKPSQNIYRTSKSKQNTPKIT